MGSKISPEILTAGAPVKKADEHANWIAARQEIEHGGFFMPAVPGLNERRSADKLAEMPSVYDFGARGDGKANDTSPLQAALDCGRPVFMPTGEYVVDRTLRMRKCGSFLYGSFGAVLSRWNSGRACTEIIYAGAASGSIVEIGGEAGSGLSVAAAEATASPRPAMRLVSYLG